MKPRLVDTTGNKYTLLVSEGMYSSDSLIELLWEVFKQWYIVNYGRGLPMNSQFLSLMFLRAHHKQHTCWQKGYCLRR